MIWSNQFRVFNSLQPLLWEVLGFGIGLNAPRNSENA